MNFDSNIFVPICLIFMIIAIVAFVIIVILLNSSKNDNLFNNCLWHMTIGLGVFDVLSPILLFCHPSKIIQWLQMVRHGASIWSYMLSSLLSYSVYYLICNKHQLDFTHTDKNRKTQYIFFSTLFSVYIIYIIVGIVQIHFPRNNHDELEHVQAFILVGTVVKMGCAIYNMVNFFVCEFIVNKSIDNKSFQYLAITALMKRIKLYPVMQFLSQILYFAGGFSIESYTWENLDEPHPTLTAQSRVYLLFAAILLYLDIVGVLFIYLLLHPKSSKRLINKLLCRPDEELMHIVDITGSSDDKKSINPIENTSNADARRSSIFSTYKKDSSFHTENFLSFNTYQTNSSVLSSASTLKVIETMRMIKNQQVRDSRGGSSRAHSRSQYSSNQDSRLLLDLLTDSELSAVIERLHNSQDSKSDNDDFGNFTNSPITGDPDSGL